MQFCSSQFYLFIKKYIFCKFLKIYFGNFKKYFNIFNLYVNSDKTFQRVYLIEKQLSDIKVNFFDVKQI